MFEDFGPCIEQKAVFLMLNGWYETGKGWTCEHYTTGYFSGEPNYHRMMYHTIHDAYYIQHIWLTRPKKG